MSQVTGDVVTKASQEMPGVPGHLIASALAVITGAIICFLGLARLGWIVEFIPLPAICAFMTGSAVSIAAGQVPKLMGIPDISTRGRGTHLVIINTLKGLPNTTIDAALGLSALVMLYSIRGFCTYMAKKHPRRAKVYFFISTLERPLPSFYTLASAPAATFTAATTQCSQSSAMSRAVCHKLPRRFLRLLS